MTRRSTLGVVAVTGVLMTVVFGLAVRIPSSEAAANTKGGFVVTCGYSHTASDDPIVYPNQPGASHSHDFFGNTSTNAHSTYQTMAESSSTCGLSRDTAGYWVPTPSLRGTEFHPVGRVGDMRIYYRRSSARDVETLPAGLEMIGGNKAATEPPPQWELRWYCGAGDEGTTPFSSHPYNCTHFDEQYSFVDGVVAIITLPRCWNGGGLLPSDVAYPVSGSKCPDGFGHLLPLVTERVHYGIMDPCDGLEPCGPADPDTNVQLGLSSGPYYTLHADFWNTWQQDTLDALVADCLNAHRQCGFLAAHSTLNVTSTGSGYGTVSSDPAGIACPPTCSATYDTGTRVTLTATPTADSRFSGWSGACDGTDACVVPMERVRGVTASFDATGAIFKVTVTRVGRGYGTVSSEPPGITCGKKCITTYPIGTEVRLVARPGPDSVFSGWWGPCSGSGACVVSSADRPRLAAQFVRAVRRPDVRVRAARQGSFTGRGVIGTTGLEQAVSVGARPGSVVRFVIQLENDGNAKEAFRVAVLRGGREFPVRYVWSAARMPDGTWRTSPLRPEEQRSFRLVVTVPRGAHAGWAAGWMVSAWPDAKPSVRDAVRARVLVTASRR